MWLLSVWSFYIQILLFSLNAHGLSQSKIAIIFNASGASTSTANPVENHIRKGADLALLEYKRDAKEEVIWIDHGESAEQTVLAIEQVNRVHPLVAVGMGNSYQALLAADRMDRSTVLVSPVATSDEILRRKANILLLSNSNSLQAQMLAKEISSVYGRRDRLLIVKLAGCPYCTDMAEAIKVCLKQKKIESVTAEIHFAQIADASQTLTHFKDFDHIVLPVLEAEAARLIDALRLKNSRATFWGGDGWGTLARYVRALPYAKNLKVHWLAHYSEEIDTPENQKFLKDFRQHYLTDPVDTSAFYYEGVNLALKLIKASTAEKAIKIFRNLNHYQGLTGRVTIKGNYVERPMPLMTLIEGQRQIQKLLQPGVQ